MNNLSDVRNTIEELSGNEKHRYHIYIFCQLFGFNNSFFKRDSTESFAAICASTCWLIAKAIENGILIKEGLAHGLVSVNKAKQIYFGQPIIDAYLLEEYVNFLGVVAHCTIDNYLINTKGISQSLIFEEKCFLKSGYILHKNLKWFEGLKGFNDVSTDDEKYTIILNNLKKLRISVSGSPRKYIENTIDFLDKIKERKPSVFN